MHSVFNSLYVIGLLLPSLRPHAYLDPGSGSLFVQILLALLLAVPFLIKGYWKKIKTLLTRSAKPTETETTDAPPK